MNKLLSWKRLWERKPEGSLCSEAWRWLPLSRVFNIQAAEGCRCGVSSSACSIPGSFRSAPDASGVLVPGGQGQNHLVLLTLCYLRSERWDCIDSCVRINLQINDFKPSSSAVEQRGPSCSAATPLGVQIHEKNPDRNKENLTSAAKEAAYLSTLLSKFAKLIILLPVKHQMSASADIKGLY